MKISIVIRTGIAIGLFAFVGQIFAPSTTASAATYTINTTTDEDSGANGTDTNTGCSLYEVATALSEGTAYGGCGAPDLNGSGNTIILPSGTYTQLSAFGTMLEAAGNSLTIQGASDGSSVLRAGTEGMQQLSINSNAVNTSFTLRNVKLNSNAQGSTPDSYYGSYGFSITAGTVSLSGVTGENAGDFYASATVLTASNNVFIDSSRVTLYGDIQLTASNITSTRSGRVSLSGDTLNATNIRSAESRETGLKIFGGQGLTKNVSVTDATYDGFFIDTLNDNGSYYVENVTVSGSGSAGFVRNDSAGKIYLKNANIHHNTGTGVVNYESEPQASTMYLTNVWIHHNGSLSQNYGGGVYNSSGHIVMDRVTINDNIAKNGAGIYSAWGGTYYDGSQVGASWIELTNVTVFNNTAENGAGIFLDVYDTDAEYISLLAGKVWRNNTIAGNTASTVGSGLYLSNDLDSNTNTNSGALNLPSIINTIIASNVGLQCASSQPITSFGPTSAFSLSSDATCEGFAFQGVDPLLATALSASEAGGETLGIDGEGGKLPMLALLEGSPAIDGGSNGLCATVDPHGRDRWNGESCDIGAFEFGYVDAVIPEDPIVVPGPPNTGAFNLKTNPLSLIAILSPLIALAIIVTLYKKSRR